MKSPNDYKGKVIIKITFSEFGLIDDNVIDTLNNQNNEIVYIETDDNLIYLYNFDEHNNKIFLCMYMYYEIYDCYSSLTYEKMNSICKIINLVV